MYVSEKVKAIFGNKYWKQMEHKVFIVSILILSFIILKIDVIISLSIRAKEYYEQELRFIVLFLLIAKTDG